MNGTLGPDFPPPAVSLYRHPSATDLLKDDKGAPGEERVIKRYVEAGLGLPWPVSTEDEFEDGTEVRVRGLRPVRPRSIYIRGQFRTRVAALDLLSGLRCGRKPYSAYKLVIGVRGRVRPRHEQ